MYKADILTAICEPRVQKMESLYVSRPYGHPLLVVGTRIAFIFITYNLVQMGNRSVDIAVGYLLNGRGLITVTCKNYFLIHCVPHCSPLSCPLSNRTSFQMGRWAGDDYSHLAPKSPQLPLSLYVVVLNQLSTRRNLLFSTYLHRTQCEGIGYGRSQIRSECLNIFRISAQFSISNYFLSFHKNVQHNIVSSY